MRISHLGQRRAVVGDHPVGPQVAHQRLVATAADAGHRRGPEVSGQLHRGHPDRSRGADDQHAAPADVGLVAQIVQRGGASEEHRGRIGVAHRVGDRHAARPGHGRQLGVGPHPGARHRRHPGADRRPVRGALLDHAGQRHPEHPAAGTAQTEREPGRRAEARREARPADPGVAGVDRRRPHPDQHVAVAQPRRLHRAHLHDLRRTVGPHHRSSHDHSPYTCKHLSPGC